MQKVWVFASGVWGFGFGGVVTLQASCRKGPLMAGFLHVEPQGFGEGFGLECSLRSM